MRLIYSVIAYSKMKPWLVEAAKLDVHTYARDAFYKSSHMYVLCIYVCTWTTVSIAGELCNVVTLTVTATTAGAWNGARTILGDHSTPTSCRAF